MPVRFKTDSKKSCNNYNKNKYICPACDNEVSFFFKLPEKCSDCLSPIDPEMSNCLKDKTKRLIVHLTLGYGSED